MASQDLSTTGLEGCQPASGDDAFYDWFLFFRVILSLTTCQSSSSQGSLDFAYFKLLTTNSYNLQ